jgi:predicted CXXCH cytochrome family protein
VRTRIVLALMLVLTTSMTLAQTQINADVLGAHNMAPASGSPITGAMASPCQYCHAPHSGIAGTPGLSGTPLWSQKLSNVQSYQQYTSTTMVNKTNSSPPLGSNSTLCLSCHDGTVALGTTTPYGQISMSGSLAGTPADLGTNLQSTHPFSFVTPLQPAPDIWPSLSANPPSTQDPSGHVQMINGNVECGSCHNPHVQNIDASGYFLAVDNSQSALCLACHSTIPSGSGMGLGPTVAKMRSAAQTTTVSTTGAGTATRNPLALWSTSAHATAPNRVASTTVAGDSKIVAKRMTRFFGGATTVRQSGCMSCHSTHNSTPGSLLRGYSDQGCIGCHSGGTNVSPSAPNIAAEMGSPKIGHASMAANGSNVHSLRESDLLNHNRHATCVDCHNPHGSRQVGGAFTTPPGVRASQSGVVGISASDGQTIVYPAVNQYENCLRCHGASTGKPTNTGVFGYLPGRASSAADPLDLVAELGLAAASSHPVTHDRNSPFPQPSLRLNMVNLDGIAQGRNMGVRILCTDCHNSDDNREFGGSGANGPHGSKYPHILERRYDMSQAPMPGQPISNLNVPPNLSTNGNYGLCAKCHELGNIMSNASFSEHARHINDGFSCSVCHTPHGMGTPVATVSGQRMVNFDLKIVAPNGASPIAYKRETNSCSLTCHGHAHGGGGSAPQSRAR